MTITTALTTALSTVSDGLTFFTQEPAIYFVAMALIGSGAGVARKFVPMKRR